MSKLKSLLCLKFENTTPILFWFRKPVLKLIFQQIFVCFNTSFKSHDTSPIQHRAIITYLKYKINRN